MLGRLDSKRALSFFGGLLWAQARRRGVPITKIHFSLRESVPDGGVDAAVDADAFAGSDDMLVHGNTFYQLKSGTTAAPWRPSWVQKTVLAPRRRKPVRANLGSAVRECLDKDGRYVLACFGTSFDELRLQKSRAKFRETFEKCGYPNAGVEV